MLNRIEVGLLRKTLIGTLILTISGAAAIGYAWWKFSKATQEKQDDIRMTIGKIETVEKMRSDLIQARRFHAPFRKLVDIGVVGKFQKTRELDRFESSLKGHGISVRGFALGGMQPVPGVSDQTFGRFKLGRFQLAFSAEVLHEDQFAEVTEAVRSSLSGLGTMESCTVLRPAGNNLVQDERFKDPLKLDVRCTVNWYIFTKSQTETVATGFAPDTTEN